MIVKSLMRPAEQLAHLDDTLDEARERMRRQQLGALPVVDGDRLVGLLTHADLAAAERSSDRTETILRDIDLPATHHCFVQDDAEQALATMLAVGSDHLAVLDEDRELVGLIAKTDLSDHVHPSSARPRPQVEGSEVEFEDNPGLRVYAERPKLKS